MFVGTADKLVDVGQDSYVLNDPSKNAAFLPFGSGIRACLGQKCVVLGVAALFASLLECYEVCTLHINILPLVATNVVCLFLLGICAWFRNLIFTNESKKHL